MAGDYLLSDLCFLLDVAVMNLLYALAIVDTREQIDSVKNRELSSPQETVVFWEHLKDDDPHNKLSISFLSLIKVGKYLSNPILDMPSLSEDKLIRIRHFGKGKVRIKSRIDLKI